MCFTHCIEKITRIAKDLHADTNGFRLLCQVTSESIRPTDHRGSQNRISSFEVLGLTGTVPIVFGLCEEVLWLCSLPFPRAIFYVDVQIDPSGLL
ncbi:hypothetical protein BaRGS_00028187, partial [Batillaria attramentaria]